MGFDALNIHVIRALVGILGLLAISTLITAVLDTVNKSKDYTNIKLRIRSWWVIAVMFTVAIILSRTVSLFFLGFVSFLALKEYLSLIPTRRADRVILFFAYLSIPVQFYWVGIEWYGMFIIFIPVYMFLFLPVCMVLVGETSGFLRAAGTLHWGLMTTVFSLSHTAYLLSLPATGNTNGGGAGLLIFLIFLTQFNDVAQFIWGKLLGRRKVVPKVSPNKTWEGLLGGVCTTTILSIILAPWLTPIDLKNALFVGLIIGIAGFFGDVTVSSLKRDLKIKDSGNIIPGHGGVLDRIDSLTYTAPLFFHFIYYFYY